MSRFTIKPLRIIGFVAFVVLDLFIYWILAMLFMGYTDFYDESEGPWMSLQSMTTKEKIIYFAIDFWYLVNVALVIWLCYRVYKSFENRKVTSVD